MFCCKEKTNLTLSDKPRAALAALLALMRSMFLFHVKHRHQFVGVGEGMTDPHDFQALNFFLGFREKRKDRMESVLAAFCIFVSRETIQSSSFTLTTSSFSSM